MGIRFTQQWIVRILAVVAIMIPSVGCAGESAPLVLESTIPLTGVTGRIDHMAFDAGRKRLFVAELGNGSVEAIDLATGTPIHRITGLGEPQGVGYSAATDLLAVASAGDGTVRLFLGETLQPLATVDLGQDADNVRVDAHTGRLFVGYGDGGIAGFAPDDRSVGQRTRLAGHPEGFEVDTAGNRIFVNVPDARQIAVLNLAAGRQTATWRIPGMQGNFPMALDPTTAHAAIVFRSPARLVLLETATGAVTTNIATCGDADDVSFDRKRNRIYISCGDGAIDVMHGEAGHYEQLSRIRTAAGARTSIFIPALDRLFVARRASLLGFGNDAGIMVFRPQP